jgi:hypothetical protein
MQLSISKSAWALAAGGAVVIAWAQAAPKGQVEAKSNLKQVAIAMVIYCADFDDVYPYGKDMPTIFGVIMPYTRNATIFKSINPGSQILFNPALGGVSAKVVNDPAGTIMFYDQKPWSDGTQIAAFSDGHVKALGQKEWQLAAKSLKLKLKRTAKPLPARFDRKLMPGRSPFGG